MAGGHCKRHLPDIVEYLCRDGNGAVRRQWKLWITPGPVCADARLELLVYNGYSRSGAVRKVSAVGGKRFLTLADVAEVLNISSSQTYALVRSGELPAIQIGGRGQWRVEAQQLEDYISRAYQKSAAAVRQGIPVDGTVESSPGL